MFSLFAIARQARGHMKIRDHFSLPILMTPPPFLSLVRILSPSPDETESGEKQCPGLEVAILTDGTRCSSIEYARVYYCHFLCCPSSKTIPTSLPLDHSNFFLSVDLTARLIYHSRAKTSLLSFFLFHRVTIRRENLCSPSPPP